MYTKYDQPTAVHLVRRRKASVPVGWHFGAVFEHEESACLHIVELQLDGLQTSTLRGFANDRDVEILRTIRHPRLIRAANCRLNYFINRADALRYNPLFQNCEHFARFVVGGKRQSIQVQKAVVLGILAVAVVMFATGRKVRWT